MNETKRLGWGILSTGRIAGTFARGLADSKTGTLVAVASRNQEAADTFGDEHKVPNRHPSYEALLADPAVEAVYIATPHPMHAKWAIAAANAGKHVLCEKPLTLNYPEAQRVVEACQRNGVLLMEAFMYRCHPQTAKIVEIVRSGVLGEIRQVEATFSFQCGGDPESRLLAAELGGGGVLDVGCYTVSFCRLIAGVAQGKDFADPIVVKGMGKVGPTGVDERANALLEFPGGITAIVSTGVLLNGGGFARIIGSKGTLRVPSPWFCGPTDGRIQLNLEIQGQPAEEVVIEPDTSLYAYEADAMAAAVAAGHVLSPAQGALDSLGNMRTLDLWRKEIGVVYPMEKAARQTEPIGGKLTIFPNRMKYGQLANVTNAAGEPKKLSRIVMGTMLEGSIDPLPHGLALFDDFYERGGTCFDTAWVYGGGQGEKVTGQWIRTRGVRDEITLIVKGAHTPECHPEALTRQLNQSFDRLGLESTDIYMMHRDNLEVPVSEFVDVLNEHVRAGRMRAFGGSNWSLERVQEANEYAAKNGLQGFTVVSNNFSLARMVDPIWAGGISSSDAESRTWLAEHDVSLFSWSSQARGFFARGDRAFTGDAELVRCWYSDDNFERLARAQKLAAEKGVSPVVIAAAYVLAQPFSIYALIGPRTLAETRDSMSAFEVELTPGEVKWLNLEAEGR